MPLLLEPAEISITYLAEFKEPQLNLIKEDSRIRLAKQLTTNFGLKLNDLKYDAASVSDRFVKFSKFFGPTFFDVSFGLEQVLAALNNPGDVAHIRKIFTLLFDVLGEVPIKSQRIIVQQQCSTKGDFKGLLQKLSPHSPDQLEKFISGRGITYHLRFGEHNLAAFVTVADSLMIDKGAFIYVQLDFAPNKYDPHKTLEVAEGHFDFLLRGLDLSVRTEA